MSKLLFVGRFHCFNGWPLWHANVCCALKLKIFCFVKKRLALFLAYNKFMGFYTSSMIHREILMWEFPKNSQMYLMNHSGTNAGFS